MKKKIIPLFLILGSMAMSCKKEVPSDCLQAKIIRVTCASTVMQVLNNNSVGDDGWLDIFNNNASYDNVFSVSNSCHIASEHKVGDVVYIKIGKPELSECIRCAMYDAPPKSSFDVKTIGNLPCEEQSQK